jgi:hypothetical protein
LGPSTISTYRLAFLERTESVALNGGEVHEDAASVTLMNP